MKKVILTILAVGLCAGAFAQGNSYNRKGNMSLGASINYGSEIESVGIGLDYTWMISNVFRLNPNATIWFKSNDLSSWDINVDLHYLIPIANRWTIYPIAGLTLSHWKWDAPAGFSNYNDTKFGVNLGAGVQYDINNSWYVNLDVKYRIISDYDQAVIGAGFGWRF